MASKHAPLTRSELTFWKAAFLAAELSLLKHGRLTAEGAAHLAADYAMAAVLELRRVKSHTPE